MSTLLAIVTTVATVALAAITALYVRKTAEMVREAKRNRDLALQPMLAVALVWSGPPGGPMSENTPPTRSVKNIGNAPALDVWAAYRQGALNRTVRPWLGYLLLVEDCEESRWPVRVVEPHFKALPEFKGASFVPRCEQLCRKFMRERYYDGTALLLSPRKEGRSGAYVQPADDLSFEVFARSLTTYAAAFG